MTKNAIAVKHNFNLKQFIKSSKHRITTVPLRLSTINLVMVPQKYPYKFSTWRRIKFSQALARLRRAKF